MSLRNFSYVSSSAYWENPCYMLRKNNRHSRGLFLYVLPWYVHRTIFGCYDGGTLRATVLYFTLNPYKYWDPPQFQSHPLSWLVMVLGVLGMAKHSSVVVVLLVVLSFPSAIIVTVAGLPPQLCSLPPQTCPIPPLSSYVLRPQYRQLKYIKINLFRPFRPFWHHIQNIHTVQYLIYNHSLPVTSLHFVSFPWATILCTSLSSPVWSSSAPATSLSTTSIPTSLPSENHDLAFFSCSCSNSWNI